MELVDQVKNIQLLLVEESEDNVLEMKRHLTEMNDFTVDLTVSYSYEEAAIKFKDQEIDVCFLKAKLGNSSVYDFFRILKEERKNIPIVLIYEEDPNERQLEDDGVNEYILRKNLNSDMLNKSIRHAIEHNEIKRQFEAQEEKYLSLFYSSLQAVFTINEDYEILECNNSFRELFKVTDLKSFDFKSVFLNDQEEELFGGSHKESGRRVRKKTIVNSAGEEIIAVFSVSPITSEIEEARYIGIIQDVTELELAEDQIAENDKLELIQRMARIIGHEVRNPLTNIFLATEEIKSDLEGNEDALVMLDMIHRNSTRISVLIDNFLKNSRPKDIVLKEQFIESVIEKSIATCNDRIVLKHIEFTTEGLENRTAVQLDEEKISIAFTNILINAIEALESTTDPELSVTITPSENTVQVVISDNGQGMSEETRKNLFTPFFSSKQGGLGLGMSNTNTIFKAHKALIKVESELNVGTSFFITIPKNPA